MPLLIHDRRLTTRVGAVVLALATGFVIFVVTILPRLPGDGLEIRVYFADVSSIAEGAPVIIAGQKVGELGSIARVRLDEAGPGHPLEGTGGIVAIVRIDEGWAARIPVNSEFFISSRGLLAPRYLAIGPPAGAAAPARTLVAGDTVRGVDPPNLDRMLQRIWASLTDIKVFIDVLRPASRELSAAITRAAITIAMIEPEADGFAVLEAELTAAFAAADGVIDDAGELDLDAMGRLIGRVRGLVTRLEGTTADVQTRVAGLRIALGRVGRAIPGDLRARLDRALASAEGALASAQQLTGGIDGILDDVESARGTIGAVMADLELFDDFKQALKGVKRAPWKVLIKP